MIQDDKTYLCLSELLPEAIKRPMTLVNQRISPFDIRIGGSLCSARVSDEKER